MTSKQVHRVSATILVVFIISHLGVHLTALHSKEAHIRVLGIVQVVYRNPVGELLLVFAIFSQIFTGLKRLKLKRKVKDKWARIQVGSGLYLMFFLINHTAAALYTHHIFEVETDFYWAAGSLNILPIKYGFAVYYFLAVLSIFAHLAAALHFGWRGSPPVLEKSIAASGALLAGLIVFAFWGVLYEVVIPEDMMRYFEANFGFFELQQSSIEAR